MANKINTAVPTLVSAAAIAAPQDIYGSPDSTQTFSLGSIVQALTTNIVAPVSFLVDFVARIVYALPSSVGDPLMVPDGVAPTIVALCDGDAAMGAIEGGAPGTFVPIPNAAGNYSRSTEWTVAKRVAGAAPAGGVAGVDDVLDPVPMTASLSSLIGKLEAAAVAKLAYGSQAVGVLIVDDVVDGVEGDWHAQAMIEAFLAADGILTYSLPAPVAGGTVAALPFE